MSDNKNPKSDFLKELAESLGFSDCKIAKTKCLEKELEYLNMWLSASYNADMTFFNKNPDLRCNPKLINPDFESVIVLSQPYYTAYNKNEATYAVGKYALGLDYHNVMWRKLAVMEKEITAKFPGVVCKSFCDTGPVMEKAWAVEAGIGWMGKNTILITPEYGSYVVLGLIFTSLVLPYDLPLENQCGDCRLCIDACPTQAIPKPYTLDANRCISYLTIEHKGDIPEELMKLFDNQVFGCDICLDVCPYNSKPKLTNEKAFNAGEVQQKLASGIIPSNTGLLKGSAMERGGLKRLMGNISCIQQNKSR